MLQLAGRGGGARSSSRLLAAATGTAICRTCRHFRPRAPRARGLAGSAAPLKIGFIGAGDISNLHHEGLAATDGATVHGLWSRTDEQARLLQRSDRSPCSHYPEQPRHTHRPPGLRQRPLQVPDPAAKAAEFGCKLYGSAEELVLAPLPLPSVQQRLLPKRAARRATAAAATPASLVSVYSLRGVAESPPDSPAAACAGGGPGDRRGGGAD